MSEKITLRKLAAELGIAASTVHRALSGHQNVRRETRQKVLRAAQKKGYLLPQREKKIIAVILSTLRVSGYLESLLPHLRNEFHRRGFRFYLILQQDIELLGDHMFDGILSLVWKKGLEKLLPQQFSIPVVTLNAASNMLENSAWKLPTFCEEPRFSALGKPAKPVKIGTFCTKNRFF